MVTMQPCKCSTSSKRGIAVISLGFASVATCPSTSRLAVANALTRCSAAKPLLRLWERRKGLPSTAMTSPGISSAIDATQARKQASKASGSSIPNTRPKVSCEGMPWGSFRNFSNQVCFARPKAAIATQPSAPQSTAAMAMTIISWRMCLRLPSWDLQEFHEILDTIEQRTNIHQAVMLTPKVCGRARPTPIRSGCSQLRLDGIQRHVAKSRHQKIV